MGDIKRDWSFLEAFFRNLLLGEQNELKSRYLLIGFKDSKDTNEQATTKKTTKKTIGGNGRMGAAIIAALRQNPALSANELASITHLSADGVRYHLKKLKAAGTIRRIGPDKGGAWEVG